MSSRPPGSSGCREAVGHVSDLGDDPVLVPVLVAEDVDSRLKPRHMETDNDDHV